MSAHASQGKTQTPSRLKRLDKHVQRTVLTAVLLLQRTSLGGETLIQIAGMYLTAVLRARPLLRH